MSAAHSRGSFDKEEIHDLKICEFLGCGIKLTEETGSMTLSDYPWGEPCGVLHSSLKGWLLSYMLLTPQHLVRTLAHQKCFFYGWMSE